MDPVTHAALGAACAQAILYRYDKRNAWLAGALAGMAPDLDIFIRSVHDPMLLFTYHRHFTHSLFFVPLGGILIGLCLFVFPRFRANKLMTLLAALLGYATHGLLDATTTYGTQWFWPFSNQRVSWDLIAIIDPFFTIPLILGLVWTWAFSTRKGVLVGLLVAALYLAYCAVQHERAIYAAEDDAVKQHWSLVNLRAIPQIGSTNDFRVLAYVADKIWVADAYVPWFNPNSIKTLGLFTSFSQSELPSYVATSGEQAQDFRIFVWFTDGFIIAAPITPLLLVDARFLRGQNPLVALWGIQFIPGQQHVKSVGNIPMENSL
jgi:inner membrane protein